MTTAPINPDQFLMGGGGAASAKFEKIGDRVRGTVCEPPEVRQQTDIATGEPTFWPDGNPKMQLVVTLQTTLRDDEEDDGKRRLFIKGKSLTEAVREAVKGTGAKGIEMGGILDVGWIGEGTASQRGFNPPKLYDAIYERPDTTAASGEYLGTYSTVQQAPAAPQAASAQAGPNATQIAALKAAGIDPKTVFPNYDEPPF
jgi:hypothetical protein